MPWKKPSSGVPIENPFSMLAFDAPSVDMIAVLKDKGVITEIAAYSTLAAKLTSIGIMYDSFDRADNASTAGSMDTGQAWAVSGGTWGISGNALYAPGGSGTITMNSALSDCTIKTTLLSYASVSRIVMRQTDISNRLILTASGLSWGLYKTVSNTSTLIGSYGALPTNGDKIKCVLSGSTISIYINGVLAITTTETFNQTATNHGFNLSGAAAARFDYFLVDPSIT